MKVRFAHDFSSLNEALDCIIEAILSSGYNRRKCFISFRCCLYNFYKNIKYNKEGDNKIFSSDEMVKYLKQSVLNIQSFPLRMECLRMIGTDG